MICEVNSILRSGRLLYEVVHSDLQKRIVNEEWGKGDRLPSEQELSREFQVSRITINRALQMLAWEGMVERRPGRGTFVAHEAGQNSSDPLGALADTPPSVPDLARQSSHIDSSSAPIIGFITTALYATAFLEGIEEVIRKRGAILAVGLSAGDPAQEASLLERFTANRVDGIILCPCNGEQYSNELLGLRIRDYPVLLLDKFLPGLMLPHVTGNNEIDAYLLTQSLLQKGHRAIAFCSTPINNTVTLEARLAGHERAYSEAGLARDPSLNLTIPTELQLNIDAVQQLLDPFIRDHSTVSAILVASNALARSVYLALRALQIDVPDMMSLACFDVSSLPHDPWNPSRIEYDEYAMGQRAGQMILAMTEGSLDESTAIFDGKFVEGSTTKTLVSLNEQSREESDPRGAVPNRR